MQRGGSRALVHAIRRLATAALLLGALLCAREVNAQDVCYEYTASGCASATSCCDPLVTNCYLYSNGEYFCCAGTDCFAAQQDLANYCAGVTSASTTATCVGTATRSYARDPICYDTCRYAFDGACDDGRPGSAFSVCDTGTDCTDCGVYYPKCTVDARSQASQRRSGLPFLALLGWIGLSARRRQEKQDRHAEGSGR